MTPLERRLGRRLPAPLVRPALALIYALLLVGIVAGASRPAPDLVYIDIPERQR